MSKPVDSRSGDSRSGDIRPGDNRRGDNESSRDIAQRKPADDHCQAPQCARLPGLQVSLRQSAPIPLDVELDCAAGELLALVGPSGSGKSTILRNIAGLQNTRRGRIICNGATWFDSDMGASLPPQRRSVGMVFQDYALFPHMSALQNVAIALPDMPGDERREAAGALLAKVNLSGLEERRPSALSGGQKQRVALARALARRPSVLLLDEPFSAVDQMTRERLKRELAAMREALDIPIILVTHDLDEALALADHITVLSRGRTLQQGRPDAVRLRPETPLVARLMGHTNIFRGKVLRSAEISTKAGKENGKRDGNMDGKENGKKNGNMGLLAFGDVKLELTDTRDFRNGDEVAWLAPGDHIVLHRRGRPSLGERENPLAGVVAEVAVLGEQSAVTVTLAARPDAVLNFKLPSHAARRNELAPGVNVVVSLLAEGIHLMNDEP